MGPDLLGIAWATGFLVVVIVLFALVDRLLTGAWDALRGSPGMGLVAGISAWREDAVGPDTSASPSSPTGTPPESPDPVATERVEGQGLRPWRGGGVLRSAA